MAVVLAAASYSRIGFSPCLAVRTRRVRVPDGSESHLDPGTISCTSSSVWTILPTRIRERHQVPVRFQQGFIFTGSRLNVLPPGTLARRARTARQRLKPILE